MTAKYERERSNIDTLQFCNERRDYIPCHDDNELDVHGEVLIDQIDSGRRCAGEFMRYELRYYVQAQSGCGTCSFFFPPHSILRSMKLMTRPSIRHCNNLHILLCRPDTPKHLELIRVRELQGRNSCFNFHRKFVHRHCTAEHCTHSRSNFRYFSTYGCTGQEYGTVANIHKIFRCFRPQCARSKSPWGPPNQIKQHADSHKNHVGSI